MLKSVLQPVLITVVVGVIGVFAVWAQQPWLAASIGASAFLQLFLPDHPSGQAWTAGVGQLCGLVGGFAGVYAAGATMAPVFIEHHELVYSRVLAIVVAVLVTSVLQVSLSAKSAAGGALALLFAMGEESPTLASAGVALVGIVLVTAMGEAARRAVVRAGRT